MANEGTIRIHRSIGGTGAAFRVTFVPYGGEGEEAAVAGERSFHELQQVRASLKMLGLGAEFIKDALRQLTAGRSASVPNVSLKNTDIVRELSLPPVKIHCSVLAEDAIKAAIGDWKKKHGVEVPVHEKASH